MKTVQLRRYEVDASHLDAFATWLQERLIPVREAAGFTVEFLLVDRERSEIVWSVSVEGDEQRFREIETAYAGSPERDAAFEHVPIMASAQSVTLVDRLR